MDQLKDKIYSVCHETCLSLDFHSNYLWLSITVSHLNNIQDKELDSNQLCIWEHGVWPWKEAWIPNLFIMHSKPVRISTANQVIPEICSHKALTYKALLPAQKNPASLTGMKEAENAVT